MPENVRDRDELLLNAIVTGDTSGIEPRDREETFIKAIAEKKTDTVSLINNIDYPTIRIYTEYLDSSYDKVTHIEYVDGETTVIWNFDDIVSHWDILKNVHFIVGFGTNSAVVGGAVPVIVREESNIVTWYLIDTNSLLNRQIFLRKDIDYIRYFAI